MRARVAVVGVVVLVVLAAPAMASAAIRIARVRYNPPGINTGSTESLNRQFVVIRNTGDRRVILTGWTLVPLHEGRAFEFPRFRLPGHHTVTIHTGTGTDRRYDLFWNRVDYVWMYTHTATLRDDDGDRIDRCHWVGGSGGGGDPSAGSADC
jgi:hypothetical protein